MEVLLAKSAGFCFGVTRAVDMVNSLADKLVDNIYTFGPIIHNEQVVKKLELRKIFVLEGIDDIILPANIVIRAHGVTPKVYEMLKEKRVVIHDATCPYVKKIHRLVEEKSSNGYKVLIVGDSKHPEVIGIKGWSKDDATIINHIDLKIIESFKNEKVCVVAQTTLSFEKWNEIKDYLKKSIQNIEIFDTICRATSERQKEAEEISNFVDAMFVVGSSHSSNTQKLYEICHKNCNKTYTIETAQDIDFRMIMSAKKIGITAGASTPDWVIEEVIKKMSELDKENVEIDFKKLYDESMVTLRNGDILMGKIIGFNHNEVFVDLGYKSDGIIPASEFTDDEKLKDVVNIGDKIEVLILRVNDADGNVLLSKKKVEAMRAWNNVESYYKEKTVIKVRATEAVKGGIIGNWNGLKVFVPASQLSNKFVSDIKEFVGTEMKLRIIEFNDKNRRLVGSQRVILEEEKNNVNEDFWETLVIGKQYMGTVKNITSFGAFVNVGGVDGLIHISDLSWKRISHPSEIVKVGDEISVVLKEFSKEKKKIAFTYRNMDEDPWVLKVAELKVGKVFDVKVVRLVPFGAFIELMPGIEGLVHISQISDTRIGKPEDVLTIGQIVKAKIIEMNYETKKINLSIKEAASDLVAEVKEEAALEVTKEVEPSEVTKEHVTLEVTKETNSDAADEAKADVKEDVV